MQPNTEKYFPFPEINISGKYVFSGKHFTATKHSLRGRVQLIRVFALIPAIFFKKIYFSIRTTFSILVLYITIFQKHPH